MYFPLMQYFSFRNRSLVPGFLVAVCLCFLLAGRATADVVSHLYEATVPVQNQDKDQRKQAIQVAFTQVLIRVSGHVDVGNVQLYPGIAQATQTATQFVQQFRYVKAEAGDNSQQSGDDNSQQSSDNNQQSGLDLWVRFDETAISHLLRANNLPVWGVTRPATLIWLVVDQNGQRQMLGADSRDDTYNILTAQAKLRGVPLRLPLLDLTDRTNLHTSDVWGNFGNTILQASQRYQTQVVLVGRLYQASANSWSGRWTLYVDSGSENWTTQGTTLADVIDPGIDQTAQFLALRYGRVDQEATGNVLVEVRQIKGLADYNRVVNYLESIPHVKDVQPVELTASSAIYRVTIPGGRLALSRGIALGQQVLASEPIMDVPMESLAAETDAVIPSATPTSTTPTSTTPTSTASTSTASTSTTPTSAVSASTQGPTSASAVDPGKVIPELSYRLIQ